MDKRAIVVRGGLVLAPGGKCCPQDLLVEDGKIAAIAAPDFSVSEDAEVVSAADRLLIPGLISSHTHSHGALNRGAVDDKVSLEMFLTGGASGSESRGVKDKYLSTALSAAEMIRKGCTACYDLSAEFPLPSAEGISAMGRAYRDAGMRAVVAPMITDKTIYEALPGLLEALPDDIRSRYASLRSAPGKATIDACARILAKWDFDRRWVRPALGPSIPLHCSDEFLTECERLASEFDVPLQTHLAESRAQASLGLARYGKSLVEHLEDLDFLSERLSAAHAIWLGDDDIARLAQRGVRVAHNPCSNLRLGSGVAPVRKMIENGIVVALERMPAARPTGRTCSRRRGSHHIFPALTALQQKNGCRPATLCSLRRRDRQKSLGLKRLANWRLDMRRTSCSCGWTVLTSSRCALR